ncbi:MAG: ABC transporter permease [Peptococcaceae bacterium]|nr:ABC transporter permease [Peptococcaceae bacterium]
MVKADLISMAAKNLMRRKSRTFLTMLGVLIGTTSIVVMVSLGIGLQESQEAMYAQWGSMNEITVSQSYQGYSSSEEEKEVIVALNDEALEYFQSLDGVTAVIPMVRISANSATYGKQQGWLEIYGMNPDDMAVKNMEVAHGRLLQATDRNAVVIGGMVGDGFYDPDGGSNWVEGETYEEYQARVYEKTAGMLDKKINAEFMNSETEKSKKVTFQVVGIMPMENSNYSYSAYAPLDVVQKIQKQMMTSEERKQKKRNVYNQITLVTADVTYTKEICQTLRDSGYNVYSVAESLEGVEDSMQVFQLALGGIGAITLLVAAIGIINTMTMSIYERTKEIAIMKVIGATFTDIRLLFLTEAGMIGLFGGLMGLIFSYTLSFVINQLSGDFMGNYMGTGEALHLSVIPWWLALFAIGFSIMIGLLAGVYPANRAVKLSPIEAMRSN